MIGKEHILFYSSRDGSGVIGMILEGGELRTPGGEITGLDLGAWTHITFVGRRLLFYSNGDRSGLTAEINQADDLKRGMT
jgi:hypothetical protein